ncbi:NAD(P)H-quinone oxidoreductase [Yokenella regensburgei]|uniref:NAD(P)H-quinone oxidoreductase n=1 Tax=Yokenella regensburgei TaxID=158877 RepID=UPI003F186E5B
MSWENGELPSTMTAIEITAPGGPEVLQATTRPLPQPKENEVLIHIVAAGVNGPDIMQRKGLYAPPPGASDIPGLEVAGIVVQTGKDVQKVKPGDHVAALIPGGGYAQYCVADASNTLPLPPGLSLTEAAALPETFMTVWLNMFERGQFKAGDTILIHGGASGIGTTATMLAKAFCAGKIITTVGSQAHQEASLKLGADVAILYKEEDFVEATLQATEGQGADIILDIVAGDYVARNYAAAAMNGRIVQIGVIGGVAKEVNLFPMLSKRLTHLGSTLRSRTPAEKAEIIKALSDKVLPLIETGAVRPQIFKTFPLEKAREAHQLMDASGHIGKVVLIADETLG